MINNIKHIQNITFNAGLIKNHTPPNITCKKRNVIPNIIMNTIIAITIPNKINIFILVYSNYLL